MCILPEQNAPDIEQSSMLNEARDSKPMEKLQRLFQNMEIRQDLHMQ